MLTQKLMGTGEIPAIINNEIIQIEIIIDKIHVHKSWLQINRDFKKHKIFKNRSTSIVRIGIAKLEV